MRTRIAAAGLLALALGGAAQAQNIGGLYTVRGTNFDGSSYSGTAQITLTSSTNCRIVWQTGASSSAGICLRNNDSFAASYMRGDKMGLTIYQILSDGSMTGVWTIADQSGAGTETLIPR